MGILVGKALIHQYKYITTQSKFTALVSGYGGGKTEALLYRLLQFISTVPRAEVSVYQPTVELTKRIIYPRLQELLENSGILYKLNKTDGLMEVWMPHGKCSIIFRSMDTPNRIIGYQSMLALIDELDVLPEFKANEVWIRIMARNRKKFTYIDGRKGINQIGVTTTPEGHKFCWKMWVKIHSKNPDYELIKAKTSDNHHLPADYVATLMATYPPQLINAYLNGEFVSMTSTPVWSGFNRDKSHTNLTMADFPKSQTMHIGMDFNIGRTAAVIGMKATDSAEKVMYIVDELHHLMDSPAMIEAIKSRYRGRRIIIYPDASGRSRKSVDASKSDIRLLRYAGFKIDAPKKNPPVRESVVSTNAMFLNAEGDRRLFINTDKCPNLSEVLEIHIYDDNSAPVKDGNEDPIDALRYLINRVFGLARAQATVGRMRFS